MHDTPMHTDVGNVFEKYLIFLRLPVFNNSDFSHFTPKMQFLCELFKKCVEIL